MLFLRVSAALALAALISGPAAAAMLGEPLHREGLQIALHAENGGTLDRTPGGMAREAGALLLVADVRADKDEPHGFAENSFIPYLSISYALTKEGAPTFKQGGLLYPVAGKGGPRYAAGTQVAGPGTYHLTYIISPPSARGMLRQTDKAGGVPDWWKPISASWSFAYPLTAK
jgi:uncharacterized protein involved in high-affinity Fe2+ transport